MSEEAPADPPPVEEVAAEPESAEPGADGSAGQEGAPEGEVDQHAEQDAEGHAEGHAEGYEGGEDPGAAPPPAEDGEGEEGGEGAAPVDGEQQEAAAEGEGQPGEGAEGEGSAEAAGGEGGEEGAAAEGQPAEGEGAAEGEAAPEEEAGPPPPPPPPPYVPPEVGDDYVPVADLPPLPEPVGRTEEGKACPLPGVESLFITGTTVEIVGLQDLGSDKEGGKLMGYVSKEDLLKDIQFRGAISDFHAYKQKIVDADYDPICLMLNEDDVFGDGNNYQLATLKEVADRWVFIEEEGARRRQLLIDEQLRAALERAKPRSQKQRKVKPWISLGSELEIEEGAVRARREPVRMVVSRKRAEYGQPFKLSDKDAHELWNSSQMECRPFKDPNFDLRKAEQDVGVQAVALQTETATQAGGQRLRPKAMQYEAQGMGEEQLQAALSAPELARFLDRVSFTCEEALIQNEITNIFADDFAALSEEDGVAGNRKESIVTEYQSFTHLVYSKNKVVSAIQWLPHRKGVVAVACTEAQSHAERVARMGRPAQAYILIWNFKDPIHPEYVLQAPYEVFTFQYNPANPEIVAAGCYNGQVVIWDTTHEHERIARMKAASSRGQDSADAADDATIPIVKCRYVTAPEFSHHSVVMDLHWLPGVEVSTRGKMSAAAEGTRDCAFFATTGGDGKVNFWDIRVERLMKKGRKAEDALDLVWKPTHSVHLISLIGMDLGGMRMCFHWRALEHSTFFVGSADGELVYADLVKPEGEDNPDHTKSCTQAHVGPIVALQRSPFYEDIILTVGDWSFQIWREGSTTPLFTSGFARDYYTCACWSPTRPAVIFLADQAGNLEMWDMLDRSHEPSIRVTLASTPFMSMAFMGGGPAPGGAGGAQAQGAISGAAQGGGGGGGAAAAAASHALSAQFLALGDSAGVLRIVELPRNLRRPVTNERKLMAAFLDREGARVADVAGRRPAREAALKSAEEAKKKAQEEAEAAAKDAASKDQSAHPPLSKAAAAAAAHKAAAAAALELDEKAEAEYAKMERRFKIQLGLIEGDEKEKDK